MKPETAYLYDAVWLYAKAVHECIAQGLDYNDGVIVINKIKRRSYRSKFVYVNSNISTSDNENTISYKGILI